MKQLILLTLSVAFPLQADQQKDAQLSSAASNVEMKREILEIESKIELLEARVIQLKSKLETSSSVAPAIENNIISINVLQDGNVSINNDREKLTKEQLMKILQNITKSNDTLKVVLRGEPKAIHQNVLSILNLCKKAGVANIVFATIPQEN